MIKSLIYWLDTHTMHPLAWPYVLLRSIQYKLEDIFWPRKSIQGSITKMEPGCPVCGYYEFTEQGLCERCGNIAI